MLAIAPLVGASLASGGIQLLSSILGGIAKGKKKKKAMKMLQEALMNARSNDALNQQMTMRNQSGIGGIQNQFVQDRIGLSRERPPVNLQHLFQASASNPFAQQPGAAQPVSFAPQGRPEGS
jgi:hypothetical protein